MPYLLLFQIGPVQSFIAAGRRTEDLYVGSRMLSELAKAGLIAAIKSTNFKPIFPNIEGKIPQGVPHRFAFVTDDEPMNVAKSVEDTVRNHWRDEFANKVYGHLSSDKLMGKGDWQTTFQRQMDNWLEFYWVAVNYSGNHGESLKQANIALAQRKLLRDLPQVEELGRKCTLTGAQSALNLDWERLTRSLHDDAHIRFRRNEYLGTVAMIKRLARLAECDLGIAKPSIRSTRYIAGLSDDEEDERDESGRRQEGYLAVLHMDGDKMGERLSKFGKIDEHQGFSKKIGDFADRVERLINKHGGKTAQLIYAGGDDVLALLPLSDVLSCAYRLQEAFYVATQCTASAGIAITPYDFPLDVALEIAREAEKKAKEDYGRNAIVVTEAHGTGQIRHAGGNWRIIGLVQRLQKHFEDGELSPKIGYDLLTVAYEMTGRVQRDARLAEVTRLLRRRTVEGADDNLKTAIESLAQQIVDFGDDGYNTLLLNWEGVAHWVILARFLAQPTREKVTS